MAFSVFVEVLNLRSKSREPVQLHQPYVPAPTPEKEPA
jgi:hypothetical protein